MIESGEHHLRSAFGRFVVRNVSAGRTRRFGTVRAACRALRADEGRGWIGPLDLWQFLEEDVLLDEGIGPLDHDLRTMIVGTVAAR